MKRQRAEMPCHKGPYKRAVQWQWMIVLALLAFHLLPTFSRSHVEGFTYMTETMSLFLPDYRVSDPMWTANSDYFYMSRPATVWLMSIFSGLVPGEFYNTLMWIALPVFLGSLVWLTRLWSGATWLACVATLLFLTLALEAQFFFNDNVVAASFSFLGIAFLLKDDRPLSALVAGACLSFAVLCRLDQILFLPLFVALSILRAERITPRILALSAMLGGLFLVHFAMWFLDPAAADLFTRMQLVSAADHFWGRWDRSVVALFLRDVSAFSLGFTAAIVPSVIGAAIALSRAFTIFQSSRNILAQEVILPVVAVTYPFAIYAVTFGKYYDPRGFLIVLPFFAPFIAVAIDHWIFRPLRGGRAEEILRDRARLMVVGLMLGPIFVPGFKTLDAFGVVPIERENAPPVLTGRIWYGPHWREWQDRFQRAEHRFRSLFENAITSADTSIIVTSNWNQDRQLQHTIAMSGWRPQENQISACEGIVEVWGGTDSKTVYHLRTHIPFLPNLAARTAAIYVAQAEECLRAFEEGTRFTHFGFGLLVSRPTPDLELPRLDSGVYLLTDEGLDQLAFVAAQTVSEFRGVESSAEIKEVAGQIVSEARAALSGENSEMLNR